jgi:predicted DNA-binding transcriptional regulator AlpA
MTFFAINEKLDTILVKIEGRDRWLTTREAVDYCGLSEKTLKRARNAGVLKASAATGKILYLKSDIDAWLKSR